MEKLLNNTLQELKPSGIRKFFNIAAEMREVISLSVGEPDVATPWHIRRHSGVEYNPKSEVLVTVGDGGDGFVGISYCYSVIHIAEALKRIKEFLEENGLCK